MFSVQTFTIVLIVMTVMAVVVFVSLFFVDAGYGRFYAPKWGPAIDNRLGWMLMEAPVFVAMLLLWWLSDRREDGIRLVFLLLFELHYFHRAFVFPWLMRGRSKMPLSIIGTAVLFNTLNAYMQGGWLFYVSPVDYYSADWLTSVPFLVGTALFLLGMGVNIHSDRIIRNLRKPGDTAHYLPRGGMFRWVTSANYFGELVEWTGFAILTWSVSGAVFALWTFANLAPRAARIYNGYRQEFPEQLDTRTTKRIIPFIF
ncbi:MAG: 3-oxo-5-alpha-steroid 4-dehydrogenase [Candidatus Cryptobacteroides sp.]|nr:3-oxo-5-alpha-steroid 4-dehydrogenase [Candidatus Cryptobacteroides sp.]MEE3466104.1 3-oxo-5-alpha-steroid 4-dehydrogenase [Candidatus Cryptobacteroides sp.]